MALIDDRDWLISHIRHCFVTSDESGFCEHVLGKDEEWKRIIEDDKEEGIGRRGDQLPVYARGNDEGAEGSPPSSPFRCPSVSSFSSFRSASSSASDAGFVLPPSPDLHFDVRPSPRPTPNRSSPSVGDDNAHKSRRVLASRQAEAAANYDPKIGDQLFVKKELEEIDIKKTKTGGGRTEGTEMVSSLRKLLSVAAKMPANPFFEFVQFDGASHPGLPVKRIHIFLSMCQGDDRWQPLAIAVTWTAKVSELIGLICHHYIQSGREPSLNNSTPAGYSLHMADDDGLVEEDFAPLDPREPISKFDFPNLALVEHELPPEAEEEPPAIITVNIPQRGWGKIQVENEGLLMRDILKIVLEKRRIREGRGREYGLAREDDPERLLDLDRPLREMGTLEFRLKRLNCYDPEADSNNADVDFKAQDHQELLFPFPLLGDDRRYKVDIVKRIKANVEAHLDISGEQVKLEPLVTGAAKSVLMDVENILEAVIINESKSKGTALFRIGYCPSGSSDVKQVKLSCVTLVANEIVDKISDILKRHSARNDTKTEYRRKWT